MHTRNVFAVQTDTVSIGQWNFLTSSRDMGHRFVTKILLQYDTTSANLARLQYFRTYDIEHDLGVFVTTFFTVFPNNRSYLGGTNSLCCSDCRGL
jgi:hypothetical protein